MGWTLFFEMSRLKCFNRFFTNFQPCSSFWSQIIPDIADNGNLCSFYSLPLPSNYSFTYYFILFRRCPGCTNKISILSKSFFQNTRQKLSTWITILDGWCKEKTIRVSKYNQNYEDDFWSKNRISKVKRKVALR